MMNQTGDTTGAGSIGQDGTSTEPEEVIITQDECENVFSEKPLGPFLKIDDSDLCENVKCILTKIRANNNPFNAIWALDQSGLFEFDFNTNTTLSAGAYTLFSPDTPNYIPIEISHNLCNGNPLEIAETILHESFHAVIFAEFNNFDIDFQNSDIWQVLIDDVYGGNTHDFMLDALLTPIAEILRELNGGFGKVSDYIGLILNGLVYDLDNEGNIIGYNQVIVDWLTAPIIEGVPHPNKEGLGIEEWVAASYQTFINNIVNSPDGDALNFDCDE